MIRPRALIAFVLLSVTATALSPSITRGTPPEFSYGSDRASASCVVGVEKQVCS